MFVSNKLMTATKVCLIGSFELSKYNEVPLQFRGMKNCAEVKSSYAAHKKVYK